MTAAELTAALGGRWQNGHGTARCPAHEDRVASLSIREGRSAILLHCFGPCDTPEVIAALKKRGLWP